MIYTLIMLNLVAGLGMFVGTTSTPDNLFAIILQVLIGLLFLTNAGVMMKRKPR